MSGVEYAGIEPGDLSPGAMNIDTEPTQEPAASTGGAEEQKEMNPA